MECLNIIFPLSVSVFPLNAGYSVKLKKYIIRQAERVSTAAYQSAWWVAGARPRRLLLLLLQAARRPALLRAGGFLPMNLHTFVLVCFSFNIERKSRVKILRSPISFELYPAHSRVDRGNLV